MFITTTVKRHFVPQLSLLSVYVSNSGFGGNYTLMSFALRQMPYSVYHIRMYETNRIQIKEVDYFRTCNECWILYIFNFSMAFSISRWHFQSMSSHKVNFPRKKEQNWPYQLRWVLKMCAKDSLHRMCCTVCVLMCIDRHSVQQSHSVYWYGITYANSVLVGRQIYATNEQVVIYSIL